MTTFEWFLLIVVVIAVPLIVAVVVTLWTLEQARQRNRRNRAASGGSAGGAPDELVKRNATRTTNDGASPVMTSESGDGNPATSSTIKESGSSV